MGVGWLVVLLLLADTSPQRRDSVTVEGKAPDAESGATTATTVTSDQVKSLPERMTTVRDALPVIPGVVRTPEGRLVISGGPEHRSALLVNSIDVTDPATGRFGATVPIDIVQTLTLYKTPFLAEYGRFSSGVVAVETRRGGDKWHYELNDPTPELRIRSAHLRGVRGFTPRFSGSGPVVRNRLYLAAAGEFALRKRPVYPLPFPRNEEKSQSINAHLQLDWIPSASHLLTLTAHGVPQRSNFVGLSFYTPQPAAPDYRGGEYRASIADRFAFRGGTLESVWSAGQVVARTGAQGSAPLVLLPDTSDGNYFLRQSRVAGRGQWNEVLSVTKAAHELRFGISTLHTRLRGDVAAGPVEISDLDRRLLARIEGRDPVRYRLSDTEVAGFAQDGWSPLRNLRVDFGMRFDFQRISGVTRTAPRVGVAWQPSPESPTTLRAGYGWFYDRVPLNVYAWPWTAREGRFAPKSEIWNVQIDRVLHPTTRLRLNYIDSRSRGLAIFEPGRLYNGGRARSRQLETIVRISQKAEQEWLISYVYTATRANLNDFAQFIGHFPAPPLRPDAFATASGNIPHRFLSWGVFPLRYGLRFAPVVDWRTGFPYSALDARQQYAETPNQRRFPSFFSLDLRASKDIPVRGHMVRLSFSLFNTTDHANFDAVRLNVADPLFGEFLGRRPRRFRLDFDWLF